MTLAASPKSARDRALWSWIPANAETGRNWLRSCPGEDADIVRGKPSQQIVSRHQVAGLRPLTPQARGECFAPQNTPRRDTEGAVATKLFGLLVDLGLRNLSERNIRILLFS
jgi:hypothetical protein